MVPRVEKALRTLFAAGEVGTKDSLALQVFASTDSVQRALQRLHKAKEIRICLWVQKGNNWIPKYCEADGKPDREKPVPTPTAIRMRAFRKRNPEYVAQETATKARQRAEQIALKQSPAERSELAFQLNALFMKGK